MRSKHSKDEINNDEDTTKRKGRKGAIMMQVLVFIAATMSALALCTLFFSIIALICFIQSHF